LIGADLTAEYVHFVCTEGYSVSIEMPTALHPQTQMTFKFDGEILPVRLGFPMRITVGELRWLERAARAP
jgi:DMSO/TMAO reductase YedYZ molybdopterin-dependent catalytic subunit